ncbi:MAG: RagB/SusD family nutrient uptake outer membrane protein, partial [Bacteroidales bacterium]|nr:RagB/SusD family nutrient uptake outer membrane protein [Candidatus Cryptobacteroides caccocaballi]
TASDLLTVIEKERVRELCFEGHSFFDIKRRKQDLVRNASSNADLLKLSYPDYRFVLPIDFTEMRANESIIQNEGYSSNF